MSQLVFCSNSFSHQTQLQVVVCVHNPTGGLLCVAGDSLWFCMCFGNIWRVPAFFVTGGLLCVAGDSLWFCMFFGNCAKSNY